MSKVLAFVQRFISLQQLYGWIRHGLQFAAGWLFTQGIIGQKAEQWIVGVLAGVIIAWIDHKSNSPATATSPKP
jgi:hypothetical protein